ALAHGDDDLKTLQRGDDLVGPAEMLIEDRDIDVALDLRPVGDLEHHVLVIVENCAANRHDASTPCKNPGVVLEHAGGEKKQSPVIPGPSVARNPESIITVGARPAPTVAMDSGLAFRAPR